MKNKITIDISLHPLAWKVLKQECHFDGKAVDVGKGWLYYLILQGLERQEVMSTFRERDRYPKQMVKGKIYIWYEDSLRYGRHMRLPRQANISRVLFRKKREEICQAVALFHICTGIERNKVMRYFLEKEGIEEQELSFEALKKHYQRHYRHKEEDLLLDIKELKERNHHKTNTKIYGQIVPNTFFMEKTLEKNAFCSAMAGIKTLHYIDIKNVATMAPYADGWNITLANGHYWSRIHFQQASAVTESENEHYRHTVELTLPAKGGVAVRDIMILERGRYLVRVTDNNGNRWVMGDITSPMRLKVADSNDGSPEGATAYTLTFSGLQMFPQMKVL